MARKDVDLVIRAKDEAEGVIKAITAALNDFLESQKDLTGQAGKTESAMGKIGAAVGTVQKQLEKFNVGEKIAQDVDKAAAAVSRLEAAATDAKAEIADLTAKLAESATATEKWQADVKTGTAAIASQKTAISTAAGEIKRLKGEYASTTAEQEKLAKRAGELPDKIAKQAEATNKAVERNAKLRQEMSEVATVSKSLQNAFDASERSVASNTKKLQGLEAELTAAGPKLELLAAAAGKFATDIKAAEASLTQEKAALASLTTELDRMGVAAGEAGKNHAKLEQELAKATGRLKNIENDTARAKAGYTSLTDAAVRFNTAIQGGTEATRDNLASQIVDQGLAAQKAKGALVEYEESVRRLAALSKGENALRPNGNAARQYAEDLRFASQAANEASLVEGLHRESLQKMGQAFAAAGSDVQALARVQATFVNEQQRLAAALAQVAAEGFKERQALRDIGSTASGAAAGTQQLANATGRAARETGALGAAYRKINGDTRTTLNLTQRLRGQVLALVAAYGGLYGVISVLGRVVDAYQTLEGAQARLNVANDNDIAKSAQDMDFLRRNANRLGVELGGLATEYSKFAIATKGTNLEGEKTRKIFLAVAEAARVNRSSQEEMRGVFTALTQIVSKGAVQMEELRQQLGDRLPGAIQLMADGLGVTTAELIKMMEQGQVTADALVPFAEKLSEKFGAGLAESLQGVSTALGRLKNAAFQALVTFGQQGFLESFVDLLNKTTELLGSPVFEDFSGRVSAALGFLADVVGVVIDNFQLFSAVVGGLIGLRLAPALIAMAEGFIKLRAAAVGATAAMLGVRTAAASTAAASTAATGAAVAGMSRFAALAGPIGAAVAVIGTGIGLWLSSTKDTTEALHDHKAILDEVKNAYDAVGGSVEKWRDAVKDITVTELQQNLENLDGALRDTVAQLQDALNDQGGSVATRLFGLELGSTASREFQQEINAVVQKLADGKLKIEDFVSAIDEVNRKYRDGSDANKQYADSTLAAAKKVADVGQKIKEARAVLQAKIGTDKEAAAALDVLTGKTEAVTAAQAPLATALEKAAEATDRLVEAAPKRKDDDEDFARLADEFRQHYQEALDLIHQIPDGIAAARMEQDLLNDSAEGFAAIQRQNAAKLEGGFGGGLVSRIIGVESGGRADAKNPNSSATGLGQFIASTWLRMFKQYFPDRAAGLTDAMILELRKDAELSREMVGLYLKENAKILADANIAITDANLYLAHFLGPGGAKALLTAAPGTKANDVLGADQIASNASILDGKTREEVIAWAQRKVGVSKEELSIQERLSEIDDDRAKKLEDDVTKALDKVDAEKKETAERISQGEFDVQQQELINAGKGRQAAIEAAIREAKKENVNITAEELRQVAEHAARLYDLNQAEKGNSAAKDAAVKAEEKVNLLLEKRQALQEQLEIAQGSGDTKLAEELRAQLAGVNAELIAAIENAKAMWEAVGGDEAATKAATLDAARAKAEAFSKAAVENYFSWKKVGDLFLNGLTSAFDTFAQAVAEGKSIGEAARDAFLKFAADFLREIAQMIIKQAIFNALSGTKLGGFLGIGAGHTGGMVGSRMVGGGNQMRQVHPAVFAGAMRYHSGGVVGLRPGEVPIIAQEGENIQTEDDPFHPKNLSKTLAGSGGGGSGGNTKIVNAIDAPSFLAAALQSEIGERVLLNWLRANPDAVSSTRL